MAAPERFAIRQIPLAPRAPSIHGPLRHVAMRRLSVAFGGIADMAELDAGWRRSRMTQQRHGHRNFAVMHNTIGPGRV